MNMNNPWQCPYCGLVLKNFRVFATHLRLVHLVHVDDADVDFDGKWRMCQVNG